ncbi:MAG: PVC-type heme-binding CxxCH protein, partial [Pirellulales bacterium]
MPLLRLRALPLTFLLLTIGSTLAATEHTQTDAVKSPLAPEASVGHFKLPPGVKIELAAAEPEVIDPVAVRFDEDGRMWVVEMRDYPNGPASGERPLSRVKVLEDIDGDGRFETARLFADQLLFATGVQPWHGGVIVTYSGRIDWMKDTDGDGRADLREHWFTGFAEENPQLRANHPRFALDNFIYVANGLRGGMVTSTWARTRREVSISGRDFRFEPLRGDCGAVSGNGQFGMTFDDYGNRFICSNRNPLMHVVLDERYLARNPLLAVPAVVNDVAAAGDNSHIFPISQAWTTSILHAGQFTAACGAEFYRGDALPERFFGCGFTCEPTGNLVHCETVEPAGATFVGRPEREGVEFLATADSWFRPVNLQTGPDGALYVVDMYRAVIEHPQFVPDELKQRPDLRDGDDRGRIYRLVAEGASKRPAMSKLGDVGPEKLAPLLAHRNPWYRNTAARLLYEHQWRQAKPA